MAAEGVATGLAERRLAPPARADRTRRQQAVVDAIVSGPRGGGVVPSTDGDVVLGPFGPLLHVPGLADAVQQVGAHLRFAGILPADVRELAVLVTAQRWASAFEWSAHCDLARAAGLHDDVIEAVRARRRPSFDDALHAAVHDFAEELLATGAVGDQAFTAVADRLGTPGTVELVALIGYYTLAAFVLNVDRHPAPDAEGQP